LGLICNAMKTNRLHEMVSSGDGIAILEMGLAFGGGDLQEYGINSNTSSNGFLKCTYKKREIYTDSPSKSPSKKSPAKTNNTDGSDSDEVAEDSERDEDAPSKHVEWIGLNCFQDLY